MQSTIGFFYAILAAITWGLAYTIDQKILQHTSPLMLLLINALITVVVTLPLVMLNGDLKSGLYLKQDAGYLILVSQLLALFAGFFILSGIKALGASLASLFEISYPLFVIIFSFLVFGGRFNIFFWFGAVLMLIGSLILVTLA